MPDARSFHLFQWSDSALPTGGFAYSQGLESLVHAGRVRDLPDLRQVLLAQAVAAGEGELIAFWHVVRAEEPQRAFPRVRQRLLASLWAREAREASVLLGRRLLDIGERLAGRTIWPRRTGEMLPVGPVAGLLAGPLGFSPAEMARSFLYSQVAQGASAAVRLLSLDPLAVQEAVWGMAGELERIVATSATKRLADIGQVAVELEIAQMRHEREEMRLFRS